MALDGSEAATGAGGRVLRAAGTDGACVFVKHFGAEGIPLGRRLHAVLSSVLPAGIWSASPLLDARGLMARERRKSDAFRAAGICVPDLASAGPEALATADAGPDGQAVLKRLRREGDASGHDALLVALAASLGRIHAAGLCHGRPHPRDTAPGEAGDIVWFDFEEEPEAAMPLLDAQARDLWLLFLQVCERALDAGTPARAMAAYRVVAPAGVCPRLARHLGCASWTLALGRLLLCLHAGKDLRRYVGATTCLRGLLGPEAPAAVAPWGEEAGLPSH